MRRLHRATAWTAVSDGTYAAAALARISGCGRDGIVSLVTLLRDAGCEGDLMDVPPWDQGPSATMEIASIRR
ncbi:hypothetical protein ACQPZX_23125 [Actinoplanes sp. CA-142083]|uniref:hypothetical protein n=1 Tax=Actinoplanes sp. CA-142083 TaxID=3239903 RepID=UPI003D8F2D7D